MQILNYIGQLPTQLDNGCMLFINKGVEIKKLITQKPIWKDNVEPIYNRNIKVLKKFDYSILAGAAGITLIIAMLAPNILGIGALPVIGGGCSLILVVTYHWIRHRIDQHFTTRAWECVNKINDITLQPSLKNENLNEIRSNLADLRRPEFHHLEPTIKQLDEETDKFIKAYITQTKKKKQFQDAYSQYITNVRNKLKPPKEVLSQGDIQSISYEEEEEEDDSSVESS